MATTLLFSASDSPSTAESPGTDTFTALGGDVIETLAVTASDSTYSVFASAGSGYMSYSDAALASNEVVAADGTVSLTAWSVLEKDGSAVQVPAPLTQLLNTAAGRQSTPMIQPPVFLSARTTMYALVSGTAGDSYDSINLSSGAITDLFPVDFPTSEASSIFIPENMSPSGNLISFIAANVTVDDTSVSGAAALSYDVTSGSLAFHDLPASIADAIIPGGGSGWQPDFSLSQDADLLVSPEIGIYNVMTGQTAPIPGLCDWPSGSSSVYFSADETEVAVHCVSSTGEESTSEDEVAIARTGTGALLASVSEPSPGLQDLIPVGWASDGDFYYDTGEASASNPWTFISGFSGHSLDPATGAIHDYAASLGDLAAVLY